jgi:hypothetical protein
MSSTGVPSMPSKPRTLKDRSDEFGDLDGREQETVRAVLIALGEDADVGPLRVPARTAVPRSRGNVLGPVGEEDDLDVGEVLESA